MLFHIMRESKFKTGKFTRVELVLKLQDLHDLPAQTVRGYRFCTSYIDPAVRSGSRYWPRSGRLQFCYKTDEMYRAVKGAQCSYEFDSFPISAWAIKLCLR
jgi:hypothetical protein